MDDVSVRLLLSKTCSSTRSLSGKRAKVERRSEVDGSWTGRDRSVLLGRRRWERLFDCRSGRRSMGRNRSTMLLGEGVFRFRLVWNDGMERARLFRQCRGLKRGCISRATRPGCWGKLVVINVGRDWGSGAGWELPILIKRGRRCGWGVLRDDKWFDGDRCSSSSLIVCINLRGRLGRRRCWGKNAFRVAG